MDWFLQHWQTVAVVFIIVSTIVLFVRRFLRRSKTQGCGGTCGCGVKPGASVVDEGKLRRSVGP